MSQPSTFDLVVIGGGPAGYVAAIRAAQLGKTVACIEKERPGGTCLNWGCIPTKALLKTADLLDHIRHAEDFGIKINGTVQIDLPSIIQRSRSVADTMAKGIEYLFQSKKVHHIAGHAQITSPTQVTITPQQGGAPTILQTRYILIATGCKPRPFPGLPADAPNVWTSKEAMLPSALPRSLIIIGAGAIGVEFAYFYNALGTKVTLIEAMPQLVPQEDHEVAALLEKEFTKQGITVITQAKTENIQPTDQGVNVTLSAPTPQNLSAEKLLLAIGVIPNLDGLLAPSVRIELDAKGYIKTNDRYQTSIPTIYAAGDIIGPPWLAHVASHEAIEAVEGLFIPGKKPHKITTTPACTYCQPQIASIGLTEKQAKEKGLRFKVAKFPYRASGRAVASGEPEGFVKLIAGEPHGEILGAHIIGAEATELIAELSLAIQLEATLDEIHTTIHPHPTLSEMVAEAALAAKGAAIHI
ncbi:MAG: dihydrolipoyl dehydrogenase [Methylacidiphilales bacterium]|nr:dihydrolipoyl dehydrogenase [Candidatus Methylacidiphilales bacterium]MDW8349093.1 dihydrolipoyl dehydrogenase [Verrucomicrobiae bacterium]